MANSPFKNKVGSLPIVSTNPWAPALPVVYGKPEEVHKEIAALMKQRWLDRAEVFPSKRNDVIPPINFTYKDVEAVSQNVGTEMTQITDRITSNMTLHSIGDLGEMLANVELQITKLSDPEEGGGILGWFQSKYKDLRKVLLVRFQKVSEAFDQIRDKCATIASSMETWIKDDDELYKQNYEQFRKLQVAIQKTDDMRQICEKTLQLWPEISVDDPEGMMKIQDRLDRERLLNLISIKRDELLRWKQICEKNASRIRILQTSSQNVSISLSNLVSQGIPIIRQEYAFAIQALETGKGDAYVNSMRGVANTALKKGADLTKEVAINSTKTLNAASIQNETLDYLRQRSMETLTAIRDINSQSQIVRENDEKEMNAKQADFLKVLQANNAV